VINLLPYQIQGLSDPAEKQDLISYLKSFPEFNKFEAKMYLNSPNGGQTYKSGTISGSLNVDYLFWIVTYKDYLITITAVLGEVHIACEKITQEVLFNKYKELNDQQTKVRKLLDEFNVNFQMALVNERFRINNEYKNRFKENKRQIKQELLNLGIQVKPGSKLSKLLRLDYLPYKDQC